jgi:hypothetical protein
MMKKKVGRVEAIIIMRAAKEFREKQSALVEAPEPVVVPEIIVEPVVQPEKSFLTYVIDFFRKKGT